MGRGSGNREEPRSSFTGFRSNFNEFIEREMHKATCVECKKECEVPFKPIAGKPVYCKDCYRKKAY